MIKSLKLGLIQSMRMYTTYAVSTLSYVIQFFQPDGRALKTEDRGIQLLTNCPRHSVPSTFLQRGREAGITIAVPALQPLSMAARFRVACRSAELHAAVRRAAEVRDREDAILMPRRAQWHGDSLIESIHYAWRYCTAIGDMPNEARQDVQRRAYMALRSRMINKSGQYAHTPPGQSTGTHTRRRMMGTRSSPIW